MGVSDPVDAYRQLLRVAALDGWALRLASEGRSHVLFHSGRGQEAVPVGAIAALRPDDQLLYGHRGLGYPLVKGMRPVELLGDLLGTTAGATRGLGAGIVHSADANVGVLGQSGTVGGNFPLAVGVALAAQRQRTGRVVLCVFGDGTANRGTFHEAANAAAVWRSPVVWLCENNGYSVSVPQAASTAVTDLADRAAGYGMPGQVVDGQDVGAVHDAVATAAERARAGEGPTLVEAKTYRFRGHFEGDPGRYRDAEEVTRWRKRDPLEIQRQLLLTRGLMDEGGVADMRAAVDSEFERAVEVAAGAPLPGLDRLAESLFVAEATDA